MAVVLDAHVANWMESQQLHIADSDLKLQSANEIATEIASKSAETRVEIATEIAMIRIAAISNR